MNLFEKIFNYQIISRLDESGAFTLTSHERIWLKTMLQHPAAASAFTPETLKKLQELLQSEPLLDTSENLVEKAKSTERQVYHPLLRPLRRIISGGQAVRLSCRIKNGRVKEEQSGFPYKLEYSMVKKEWYLLWYDLRHHMLMSTKLGSIVSATEEPLLANTASSLSAKIAGILESRKEHAVIEVVRAYNKELSRILYAFSCYEKKVEYIEDIATYRIQLTFLQDESEYILSKIRFLGQRVKVIEGMKLQRRMYESASRALARYGVENNKDSPRGSMI